MAACHQGHLIIAQYLLDRGMDINAKDDVSNDVSGRDNLFYPSFADDKHYLDLFLSSLSC